MRGGQGAAGPRDDRELRELEPGPASHAGVGERRPHHQDLAGGVNEAVKNVIGQRAYLYVISLVWPSPLYNFRREKVVS